MKRIFIAAALAQILGGLLTASTVISCSGVATSTNPCYASALPNFQTRIDWAIFGFADGNNHNGLWTASANNGLTINVKSINTPQGVMLVDNYDAKFVNGAWVDYQDLINAPANFMGNFDAPPDTSATSAFAPGDPGDHLIRFIGNTMDTNGKLILNFNGTVQAIGFRIQSNSDTNPTFTPHVQLYSGAFGTGSVILDTTIPNLSGGGECQTLTISNSNPPTPCNIAPLIGFVGYPGIRSIGIQVDDVDGFLLGNLSLGGLALDVPEPTPLIFCGCGLALLAVSRRHWRRGA